MSCEQVKQIGGGSSAFTHEQTLTTTTPTGTTATIDWSSSRIQVLDLGSASGNVTVTFSGATETDLFYLRVIQGGTARSITWPAAVRWADGQTPVLSQGDDDVDWFMFIYDGTNFDGIQNENFS